MRLAITAVEADVQRVSCTEAVDLVKELLIESREWDPDFHDFLSLEELQTRIRDQVSQFLIPGIERFLDAMATFFYATEALSRKDRDGLQNLDFPEIQKLKIYAGEFFFGFNDESFFYEYDMRDRDLAAQWTHVACDIRSDWYIKEKESVDAAVFAASYRPTYRPLAAQEMTFLSPLDRTLPKDSASVVGIAEIITNTAKALVGEFTVH